MASSRKFYRKCRKISGLNEDEEEESIASVEYHEEAEDQDQEDEENEQRRSERGEHVTFEMGQSQKGAPVLWFQGFRFTKSKDDGTGRTTYWRCASRNASICHVRAVTAVDNPTSGRIIPSANPAEHNHAPDLVGQKVEARLAELKKRIIEEPQASTAELLIGLKSTEYDDEVIACLPNDKALYTFIARTRKKNGQTPRKSGSLIKQEMANSNNNRNQSYIKEKRQQQFKHCAIIKEDRKRRAVNAKQDQDFLSMNFIDDHGDSTGTTKYNNFTTPSRHYVPQMPPPPQQPQPRDRLTLFSTFVDATIRNVNAQAPEVANQLMQSINATIGTYLMHLPAPQHVEVEVPATTSDTTLPTTAAENIGVGEHIEIQYV